MLEKINSSLVNRVTDIEILMVNMNSRLLELMTEPDTFLILRVRNF
jgi:hypothetical protein